MRNSLKSFTLLELLIAIVLLSVIVLSISSIEVFSRHNLMSSDIRAKIQNDISFVLEHMTKHISRTIGNDNAYPNQVVAFSTCGTNPTTTTLAVFIDANYNGKRDTNDHWVVYEFSSGTTSKELKFCFSGGDSSVTPVCPNSCTTWETLSTKIRSFGIALDPGTKNVLDVTISGLNSPTEAANDIKNPSVKMATSIFMPEVSIN